MEKFYNNHIKCKINTIDKIYSGYYLKLLNKSKKANSNKIKYKKISFLINLLIITLIPISFSRKLNSNNEIILKVKGGGIFVQFLKADLSPENRPFEVIINNENKGYTTGCTLNEPENTIIIKWDSPINTCENLFYNLYNILEADLSNFDSSQSTSMCGMFQRCTSLRTINLKNLDTSKSVNMASMFCECSALTSLDLSSFNTSSVTNMRNIFSLCSSLVQLDISSFNTDLVSSMDKIFYGCESLISLDLSNFNLSSVYEIVEPFNNCKSLVFINMNNIQENRNNKYNYFQNEVLSNLVYCIDINKSPKIYGFISQINNNNNCSNICFSESRKIIREKNKCIDDCNKDDTYKYEYNNICYSFKQSEIVDNEQTDKNENTFNIESDRDIEKTESIENTENVEKTEGLENTEKIENSESIENVEKTEKLENTEKIENTERIVNTEKLENTEKIESTEKTEDNDKVENSEKEEKAETTMKIENTENNKIHNTDIIYTDEVNNSKLIDNSKFSSENFFKEKEILEKNINDNIVKKDEIIQSIKEDLISGNLDTLLENVTGGEKKDLLVNDNQTIFQITTTDNQKNNNYTNISTVNF